MEILGCLKFSDFASIFYKLYPPHLLSYRGIHFNGGTLGVAFISGMCNSLLSAGVIQVGRKDKCYLFVVSENLHTVITLLQIKTLLIFNPHHFHPYLFMNSFIYEFMNPGLSSIDGILAQCILDMS